MTIVEIVCLAVVIMLIMYFIYSFIALYSYHKKMFGCEKNFNFSRDNVFVEERYEYFTCDDNGNLRKEKSYLVYVRVKGAKFLVKRFTDRKKAINCILSLIRKESEE